jgi:hypothetical protein
MMSPRPFAIHVPDDRLADLHARLERVRWPDEAPDGGWQYGSDLTYMKALVAYWREQYDWRAHEARLNRFPQDAFTTLMSDVLGYPRFAAQGGDWGAYITAQLGAAHADQMVGVHVTLLSGPRDTTPEPQTAEERAYVAELQQWMREEQG